MLLAIDTCGSLGSLALGRVDAGELRLVRELELAGKSYAAQLVPAVWSALAESGAAPGDLQCIVVVNGPGSFTGVRVGVSSAKGLAEALAVPVLAVSRLAVLAYTAGVGAAALDAGRGEFYFGGYAEGAVACAQAEALLTVEEVRCRVAEGELAVCEERAEQAFPAALRVPAPMAADALRFAMPRVTAREYDEVLTLDGHYLRRPDAELVWNSKAGAAKAGGPRVAAVRR